MNYICIMKSLRRITLATVAITIASVIIIAFNVVGLYKDLKQQTLDAIMVCAINADILEMISRMRTGDDASQSYIRLNSYVEAAQQKDGMIASADTLNLSLQRILRVGLEFPDHQYNTDYSKLDSIFKKELERHQLHPDSVMILSVDTPEPAGSWWTLRNFESSGLKEHIIYISPMRGEIMSRLWGIIIPICAVLILFVLMSVYLIRTVRNLKSIDQMKDDFTHNMTHELKTPVAVAYSAADSMLKYYDHSDEKRNRQFLGIILQRLSYLSGMIENILSMSMERFKTLQLRKNPVKLKKMAEEISDMIKLKSNKEVSVNLDIADDLIIEADAMHFGNVLSNIIENAVKYSGESVEIHIKGDSGSISISDNGIGMENRCLHHIFDKFYRVPSGDRYEVGGYGLGLFYVKQIVDLHGWNIFVKSRPGEGSTFIIRFKDVK